MGDNCALSLIWFRGKITFEKVSILFSAPPSLSLSVEIGNNFTANEIKSIQPFDMTADLTWDLRN